MEEEIRFVVFKNLSEVKTEVDNLDGLCYYFANNIKADLEMMEIPVNMYNINEGEGYDHYYLLAGDNADYLIDPTYSQFLPKLNETPILFEDFPASVLEKTEQGKEILGDLLRNGYHKLSDDDFDVYLSGFKLKERKRHKWK